MINNNNLNMKKIITWLASLFNLYVIDQEYKDVISEKSKKIKLYYKEMKKCELDYDILYQKYTETKVAFDLSAENLSYIWNVWIKFEEMSELVWLHNMWIISNIINWIKQDILNETARSSITKEEIIYRSGAIDILNTFLLKINDIKKYVDETEKWKDN